MTSRRSNTLNVLLISLVMAVIGYVIRTTWLPTSRETNSLLYHKDSLLNFTELTAEFGCSSEEHKVYTEDDYILTMFRIANGRNCHTKTRSPPVLLMHGLLLSSDSWIDAGPNTGLAYLISDACYDVWVGNVRGNYYSRDHINLDPDKDSEYWKFDVDEFGRFDLPAMIDYVLNYTGHDKLNYIGYSQGSGIFFVMCSERPEYCDKVQLLIGLAPAVRIYNTQSIIIRSVTLTLEKINSLTSIYSVQEVLPKGTVGQEFVAFLCQISGLTDICEFALNLLDHVDHFHLGSITKKTTKTLFGHFPAGTSLRNMARYGQNMRSGNFQKFDYGKEQNLVIYGSEEAPIYNLSATIVPFVCIYGQNDGLVDMKDIDWLLKKIPNVVGSVLVKDPMWNHFDLIYSQHIGDTIFPAIYEYLFKYTTSSFRVGMRSFTNRTALAVV